MGKIRLTAVGAAVMTVALATGCGVGAEAAPAKNLCPRLGRKLSRERTPGTDCLGRRPWEPRRRSGAYSDFRGPINPCCPLSWTGLAFLRRSPGSPEKFCER